MRNLARHNGRTHPLSKRCARLRENIRMFSPKHRHVSGKTSARFSAKMRTFFCSAKNGLCSLWGSFFGRPAQPLPKWHPEARKQAFTPLNGCALRAEVRISFLTEPVILSSVEGSPGAKDACRGGTCSSCSPGRARLFPSTSSRLRGSLDCAPPNPGGTPLF